MRAIPTKPQTRRRGFQNSGGNARTLRRLAKDRLGVEIHTKGGGLHDPEVRSLAATRRSPRPPSPSPSPSCYAAHGSTERLPAALSPPHTQRTRTRTHTHTHTHSQVDARVVLDLYTLHARPVLMRTTASYEDVVAFETVEALRRAGAWRRTGALMSDEGEGEEEGGE
jgi:hypothetical protein